MFTGIKLHTRQRVVIASSIILAIASYFILIGIDTDIERTGQPPLASGYAVPMSSGQVDGDRPGQLSDSTRVAGLHSGQNLYPGTTATGLHRLP